MAGGDQAESEAINTHGDEPAKERFDRTVAEPTQIVGETDAIRGVAESRSSKASPPDKKVADLAEFQRVLIELGLSTGSDLAAFEVDPALGVLGLARALVRVGRLTPYQSAAIYQNKSRGLLVGKYLILDKLGQGGMGVVFKARQRTTGKVVALKILPPSFARDHQALSRFKREIAAAGRLNHPNIVAALDADLDRGVHFLVMDYVEGRDLDRVVLANGPMPVAQAVDCLILAARGLEAAHAEGIVHRDIKPGNLMLDAAGNVRVLDLGLARIVEESNPFAQTASARLTRSGMYMGTVDYMAPEQAEDSRHADHRADIYSLGCTLYYLLTGREPFPRETILKRLMAHLEHPAPKLRAVRPDVPEALETIFQGMLAKKPADRPATMTELIGLLESCQTVIADASGPVNGPPKWRPELIVFNEPLRRGASPARTEVEPTVLAEREEPSGLRLDADLRLEDLAMDVRSDSPAPSPPIVIETPALGVDLPKHHGGPRLRRFAPTEVVGAVLGSIAVLGMIVGGILVFSRNPDLAPAARPKSDVALAPSTDRGAAPAEDPDQNEEPAPPASKPNPEPTPVVSKEPARPVTPSPEIAVAAAEPLAKSPAPKPEPSTSLKPANPKPTPAKSPVKPPPAPRPRWVLFGERNRYFARNIPEDAFQKMGELVKQGHALKSVAFSPNGGWVILWGKNGHSWKNLPPEPAKLLADLASKGEELKSISFTPADGFTVLFGHNGNYSQNIPDDTLKALVDLSKRGIEIKAVSFTPKGGAAILYGRSGFYTRKVPDEAVKTLGALAKRGEVIKSIAFGPDGSWVILHGPNGFFAANIPDEAFKVLADMASKGALNVLTFPVRPLFRLSSDDAATRERILTLMAQHNIPGLGIALVNKGQIEWARGYGVMSAGGSQAVTDQTRFQAASISKPVTAVAALRLVDRGKLQLDQPLYAKLVSWKVPENDLTKTRKPNLRQVLSHSAGFSVHGFAGYSPGAKIPSLREVLDGKPPANSPAIRIESAPGSKLQYSGGGFCVLQQLMIDVTGKPFGSAMRDLVLDPAGMTQSRFEQPPDAELEGYAAAGHVKGVPLAGRWHVYPELAAAGLWTTPSDLARFVIAIQQAKKQRGQALLSSNMIGEMLLRQSGDAGLGVFLGGHGRSAMFTHSGGNAGFECLMIGFTETGQGAVIMSNANDSFGVIEELMSNLSVEYDWPG